MALNTIDAKIRIKRSTVTGATPSIGPSSDHTDGTWGANDIYSGELYLNVPDQRLWLGVGTGTTEIDLASIGAYLPLTGGTMTGDITMAPFSKIDSSSSNGYLNLDSSGLGINVEIGNNGGSVSINEPFFGGNASAQIKSNQVILKSHSEFGGLDKFGEIYIADNSTANISNNIFEDNYAVFVGTKGSTINSGVVNSVILGGSGMTATADGTVYVPDLNIKDGKGISFGTGNTITTKTYDIGDWDMDVTATAQIAHGLSATEWKTVTSIIFIIRDDADAAYNSCPDNDTNAKIDSGNIRLNRLIGGKFDNILFDSTSYNRGWVTITYTPD